MKTKGFVLKQPCLYYTQNFVIGKKGSTPYMWSWEFIVILIEIFDTLPKI